MLAPPQHPITPPLILPSTAYTTTVSIPFTVVVYAEITGIPRNVTTTPYTTQDTTPSVCPGPDIVLYVAFGLAGFGAAIGLEVLLLLLCCAGSRCRDMRRTGGPRCEAPKPPPANVEEIEMA